MAQVIKDLSASDLKKILKENSVLCIYGVSDGSFYWKLQPWLKEQEEHYLIFIEEEEHLFLRAKELPFAQDPKVRLFFYQREDRHIFSHIAWEFLFLKM